MPSSPDVGARALLNALRSVLCQLAEPSQVLKTILGQAVSQTGADRGVFVEVTREGKLSYRVLYKFEKEDLAGDQGHYSRNIFAEVLDHGRPVRLENALDDPRFMTKESIQGFGLTSILCVPILIEKKIAAMVHLESDRPDHFTSLHETLLVSMCEIAGSALVTLQAGQGMLQEREQARIEAGEAKKQLEETRETLAKDWSFARFVGKSETVRVLEQQVAKAARTDFPVLLLGETGTGKSILARILHHTSPRAKKSMMTVFCPSFEKGMVETELFGHKKGAFTGAVADRQGKVQMAEGGTLFLDEVGDLPAEIQPKLLRLLQEKTYERVGDPTERKSNARIIAATNRDLEEEIREGRFRRDLYERLNFVPIRIPPLRERRDDIPLLLEHGMEQHEAGRWIELSEPAKRFLIELDFTWPGNVRHLEQLAARLAMEGPEKPVEPELLMRLLDTSESAGDQASPPREMDLEIGLPALLEQEEKKWLQEALSRHPGMKRSELAAKLKISEAALYKKLRLYDLGGR